MVNNKYSALVNWPEGGPDNNEVVDADRKAGETPLQAIERVLQADYDPGWVVKEVKEYVPEVTIYSRGAKQGTPG